jgi:hypothetical protein
MLKKVSKIFMENIQKKPILNNFDPLRMSGSGSY